MGKRTHSSLNSKQFSVYFSRYAHKIEYLEHLPVAENLNLVIAIPCFNEPDLNKTLRSLYQCYPTKYPVEIIVLINQSVHSHIDVHRQNEKSYKAAKKWAEKHNTLNKQFHIIRVIDIPEKKAGVGQARKLVMDEAIRRLEKSKAYNGIVVGLDADSHCDPNYLCEIESYFEITPSATGATIYFEHPISMNENENHLLGIASYELHLRYLIHALRYIDFPYAFHTLGSCMAVRAEAYVKQGGMNIRKAGEDFYFLQKIIPLGNFGEINTTRVIPSSRISNRVPFGTGKAMMKWANSGDKVYKTYNPLIFEELDGLFSNMNILVKADDSEIKHFYKSLKPGLKKFIEEEKFIEKIKQFQLQSSHLYTFRYKFFQWMSGLNILKFMHFARDEMYDNVPVTYAYTWLKEKIGLENGRNEDVFNSLTKLRLYDKAHAHFYKKTTE